MSTIVYYKNILIYFYNGLTLELNLDMQNFKIINSAYDNKNEEVYSVDTNEGILHFKGKDIMCLLDKNK